MLIINRKEGDNVEKMLRRYRRKHRSTKLIRELRRRQHFTKPSVKRRFEILKAKYVADKEKENNL